MSTCLPPTGVGSCVRIFVSLLHDAAHFLPTIFVTCCQRYVRVLVTVNHLLSRVEYDGHTWLSRWGHQHVLHTNISFNKKFVRHFIIGRIDQPSGSKDQELCEEFTNLLDTCERPEQMRVRHESFTLYKGHPATATSKLQIAERRRAVPCSFIYRSLHDMWLERGSPCSSKIKHLIHHEYSVVRWVQCSKTTDAGTCDILLAF